MKLVIQCASGKNSRIFSRDRFKLSRVLIHAPNSGDLRYAEEHKFAMR